jgi:hypothetical protein
MGEIFSSILGLLFFVGVLIGLIGLVIYTLILALRSLSVGIDLIQRARSFNQQRQAALILAAINFLEPPINMILITVLFVGNISNFPTTSWFVHLPMAMVLLPIIGLGFSHHAAHDLCASALGNGLLRWAVTAFSFLVIVSPMTLLVIGSLPVGVWLLHRTVKWGESLLASPTWSVSSTFTPPAIAPVARPAYARPAAPPLPVPVGPPTPCPVCRSTTGLYEQACSTCGLVFVSRIPQALQSLPSYTILRPLGDGGMSSVYLARVGQTDSLCVIKTLVSVDGPGDAAWRTQAARCLDQEAAMLGQIEHPHIARLLDRIATPLEALVLQYIPGPTLADRIAQQRPQPAEALAWAAQTAEVLAELAALPEPLLHLDIKPANLILPPNRPGPVLVDFGGAMTARQLEQPAHNQGLFGTPGYAAPEQYRGLASPKSDVYGLAATLYFALTNDDPADHPMNFPMLHTLPHEVAELLRNALAYDPLDRPSAEEFANILRGECKV